MAEPSLTSTSVLALGAASAMPAPLVTLSRCAGVLPSTRQASDHQRRLECTIYLTGVKKDQLKVKEGAKPDSPDDLVNKLLEAKDPKTGEPYVKLKAGRPDWPGEFQSIKNFHGRENIGVVFCGAPMIAEALKQQCEKLSEKKSTIFRLHKENF